MATMIGIIPARYRSTRLEGKMLLPIDGVPMIQRVYEQAIQSRFLQRVLVAADDPRIQRFMESIGGEVVMTSDKHGCGTDRVAEAARHIEADVVINIQGDQPFVDPCMIDELAETMLQNPDCRMATVIKKIRKEDLRSPSVVKVVFDCRRQALFFSRALIPYPLHRGHITVYEHVGLYAYRKDFLQTISQLPMSPLEMTESLEQLRVLENGYSITVVETQCRYPDFSGFGVDTQQELEEAERLIRAYEENSKKA
ncbi:MAG TPA: 3-deoxy-manno-octulosonate cytidylyltransferase [bacterium]|nr:3-deoxy-manno-octulosonate cytidylyltransferase [bacterium]